MKASKIIFLVIFYSVCQDVLRDFTNEAKYKTIDRGSVNDSQPKEGSFELLILKVLLLKTFLVKKMLIQYFLVSIVNYLQAFQCLHITFCNHLPVQM